ncbi:zinc-ribbon domain-containing protein [Nannocystis pusilla]|uniref:Zinc-ribbon domain-containing protein n=1 Tax=Nannocystis pusilla TaxID=889268 RepID=A0A9X3EML1_9BACT|nr:GYF domain-containing protein [Nannocystis pusilla]MCY1006515.1 zinc-ribbon domain-containing protein [Nannocystis pusilla]
MKIECDKCGAKYSIADDKVRGKTFKIRCKKCSNVIIVRDKAGGAEDGGDAPADEPGWHLAIGGETVGPISEAEVRERFAAGEIDKDTSVWQEGFEDWLPLGDVGAFSDLAAAPRQLGARSVRGRQRRRLQRARSRGDAELLELRPPARARAPARRGGARGSDQRPEGFGLAGSQRREPARVLADRRAQ